MFYLVIGFIFLLIATFVIKYDPKAGNGFKETIKEMLPDFISIAVVIIILVIINIAGVDIESFNI